MFVRTWRTIGAIGILAGLASLIITTVMHWQLSGDTPTATAVGHPAAWETMGLLAVLGPAVWLIGILVVTALVRERGWVLTTIGGLATTLALACGVGHLALYFGLVGDLAGAGLSDGDVDTVLAADGRSLISSILLVLFLAGYTLGPVVLAIGLRRARLVPVWLPVAAIIAGVANTMPGPAAGIVQLAALAATYLPLVLLLMRQQQVGAAPSAPTPDAPVPAALDR